MVLTGITTSAIELGSLMHRPRLGIPVAIVLTTASLHLPPSLLLPLLRASTKHGRFGLGLSKPRSRCVIRSSSPRPSRCVPRDHPTGGVAAVGGRSQGERSSYDAPQRAWPAGECSFARWTRQRHPLDPASEPRPSAVAQRSFHHGCPCARWGGQVHPAVTNSRHRRSAWGWQPCRQWRPSKRLPRRRQGGGNDPGSGSSLHVLCQLEAGRTRGGWLPPSASRHRDGRLAQRGRRRQR